MSLRGKLSHLYRLLPIWHEYHAPRASNRVHRTVPEPRERFPVCHARRYIGNPCFSDSLPGYAGVLQFQAYGDEKGGEALWDMHPCVCVNYSMNCVCAATKQVSGRQTDCFTFSAISKTDPDGRLSCRGQTLTKEAQRIFVIVFLVGSDFLVASSACISLRALTSSSQTTWNFELLIHAAAKIVSHEPPAPEATFDHDN